MAEETKKTIETTEVGVVEVLPSIHFVKFSKPYKFAGETYDGLDLAPLEDVCGADDDFVRAYLRRRGVSATSAQEMLMIELTPEYVKFMISCKCGIPVEFFDKLPYGDFKRVQVAYVPLVLGGDME